jgi:predicted outer membrane protein
MKISWRLIAIILITTSVFFISCGDEGNVSTNDSDTTATSKEDAEDKNDSALSMKAAEKDAQFLVDVVASNYGEVKLAKLGQQRSSHQDLKEVAKLLEADHTAVLNDLKSLASAKSIVIPTEESPDAKDKLKELGADKASEFDKEWCETLMDSHKNSITRFENAANDISDTDIKNFVNTVLPKLRTHHDKLMECHKKLK